MIFFSYIISCRTSYIYTHIFLISQQDSFHISHISLSVFTVIQKVLQKKTPDITFNEGTQSVSDEKCSCITDNLLLPGSNSFTISLGSFFFPYKTTREIHSIGGLTVGGHISLKVELQTNLGQGCSRAQMLPGSQQLPSRGLGVGQGMSPKQLSFEEKGGQWVVGN